MFVCETDEKGKNGCTVCEEYMGMELEKDKSERNRGTESEKYKVRDGV